MGGRGHLVGVKAHGKGLMLSILRYANELRDPKPYFEGIDAEPPKDAVKLATQLIEAQSGKFEPKAMPNQYVEALRDYLTAKVENRAPEVTIAPEGKPAPQVINIMAALKESMEAKGRARVRDAVRKRNGKAATRGTRSETCTAPTEPTAHGALVVMHPAVSHGSREKNGDDLRADHSEPHYSDSYVLASEMS